MLCFGNKFLNKPLVLNSPHFFQRRLFATGVVGTCSSTPSVVETNRNGHMIQMMDDFNLNLTKKNHDPVSTIRPLLLGCQQENIYVLDQTLLLFTSPQPCSPSTPLPPQTWSYTQQFCCTRIDRDTDTDIDAIVYLHHPPPLLIRVSKDVQEKQV